MKFFPLNIWLLSITFLGGSFSLANAQEAPIWLQAGLGFSTLGGSYTLSLSTQSGSWTGSLKVSNTGDELFATERFLEVGAVAGPAREKIYGYRDEGLWFSATAGLSLVNQIRCTRYCGYGTTEGYERVLTVGLPVEASIFWRTGTTFGIGIQASVSLNGIQPYAASHIVIQWGRLK